jgi:hypothetical protein
MSGTVSNRIVTDGLVVYLDASNPRSYPGSGNTWYDLTNNASHFTLYNSPPYDGTSLSFASASAQYAEANSVTTGNFGSGDFTMEFLVNITDYVYVASVMSKRWFDAIGGTFGGGGWNWRSGNNLDGGPSLISDASPEVKSSGQVNPSTLGTLYHGCATISRSGTSATINTYINNVLKSTVTGNLSNTSIDNTITNLKLMAGKQGELYCATGKLYMARLYNRTLSAAEVQQNYNALKPKFRI